MAITYPLIHPSTPGFRSISIRPANAVALTASPFTGQQQVQAHQGQYWQADVQLPPIKQDTTADDWAAWLTGLNGQYGTFLLGDSSRKIPRGTSAAAIDSTASLGPIVSGGSQSGNVLVTAGWNPSAEALKAGDYIQLGGSNLILRSQDFSHASWSKANVTVTADNTTAPDGTTTADRIVSGTGDCVIFQSFSPGSTGGYYVFSIWLKSDSGTVATQIGINNGLAYVSASISITTTWKRFDVAAKFVSGTSCTVAIGRGTDIPDSSTIYAWEAQVNEGTEPDANITTTTAAIQLTRRLHKITTDAYADAGTAATLNIWPRLRESPATSARIKVKNCQGTFRLAGEPSWSVGPDKVYDIGFSAVEAI